MYASRNFGLSFAMGLVLIAALPVQQALATDVTATLAAIEQRIAEIDSKMSADEQTLRDVKIKYTNLVNAFIAGGDLQQLLDSTLSLLSVNDAVAADLANIATQLISVKSDLGKLAEIVAGGTGTDGSVMLAIQAALAKVDALAVRRQQDSQQADGLHTAIKQLALKIQARISLRSSSSGAKN